MTIAVFDFGGSAVKYGYWQAGGLYGTGKFSTPNTWSAMKKQMEKVVAEYPVTIEGIGISAPGVVNAKKQAIGGISAISYIHEVNIWQELEALFKVPVTVENDANCAGLAEIAEGAGKGHQEAVFVIVGTGVGGAVFSNGQLKRGAHLYGGEFGLMFLDGGETFSALGSAVHMAWRYCERKGAARDTYSGQEVFALAESGEPDALKEVEAFYDHLTQGLFTIQFALDPEIIVVGGGISAKKGLIEELNHRMLEKLAQFGLTDFTPKIVACHYQNDANLIGAAANFSASHPNSA